MGTILIALIALLLGAVLGYAGRTIYLLAKKKTLEIEVKQIGIAAKEEAQKVVREAEAKAEKIIAEAKSEEKQKRDDLKSEHERLIKKEEFLDKRQLDIDKESESLKSKVEEVAAIKTEIEGVRDAKKAELEKVASLSAEEAKEQIIKEAEERYSQDLMVQMQKLETSNREKFDKRAQEILVTAIQRLASSTAADVTTTNVAIPNEDLKGKIIGKEGRNIKSFERAAGVELIVDETPGAIIISSFDPIRRQIARLALENLILDGRIQPAKIEEFVDKAKEEINKIIKEKGEQAVMEVGVLNLDPRIVAILGRLYFRTSYGQNVLQHSVEMAHIAGMLAEELKADVAIAKAGALVHDIGKALDHEVQGTHVDIGIRILQKFGADPRIVTAMKSHHDDVPHESIEAVIVQAADNVSGARPGARRDTVENYIKRLQDLETVATSFDGIEKAYALSAGREVRVFVRPGEMSDAESKSLARNIADRIEQDLKYPGEIKVTVIRESRVIEYAR